MRLKAMLTVLALCLLGMFAYYNFFMTLFFVAGVFWGLINLYIIKQLLYELLMVKQKNFFKIALFTLIKFPLLYGVGFALLYYEGEFAWALLAGFTMVLLFSMQKKFWKALQTPEKKVTTSC